MFLKCTHRNANFGGDLLDVVFLWRLSVGTVLALLAIQAGRVPSGWAVRRPTPWGITTPMAVTWWLKSQEGQSEWGQGSVKTDVKNSMCI